ncbi:MAG TPA: 16S rRNA (cytosine(1402)-N(4))-methyltransferase RsmH, partial [Thermosulfidibacter takaii]|nr:16S rRNA (cytosine(1402)-N(4))-methyltransferase RsmH [Thermosulfidibacter takaii]
HVPVMVSEVVHYLEPCREGVFVDGTLGGGGHALAILEALEPTLYVGIDRDEEALKVAAEHLALYGDRVRLVHGLYSQVEGILEELGIEGVDAFLLDLGLSSLQLEGEGRGFSFQKEEPLDMRMDRRQELTAARVVNTYSQGELERIFREYGEERWAKKIARNIVDTRRRFAITTTTALAQVVEWSIPRKFHPKKIHPATRVFQALRIEVNKELEELEKGLEAGLEVLRPGGRFLVISFHSLEDGIVKRAFREWEREGLGEVITKKPVTPSAEEVEENIRSRSGKLRVFQKG